MPETMEREVTAEAGSVRSPDRKRARWIVPLLGVGLLIIGGLVLAEAWPFSQRNVIHELEQATSSQAKFGSYRRTYFPHPGCVAENVVLQRGSDEQTRTVMTVRRLTIAGSFAGLFREHVALIRLEGAHAVFPPYRSGPTWQPTESKVVVDELQADDAVLEFARNDRKADAVRFVIDKLVGRHLATHDPMTFDLRVQNPTPPGEVVATGTFGPWNMQRTSATPLSGNYSFEHADLGVFGGIGGTLSSKGQFHGSLEQIEVDGTTLTPDFNVKDGIHKLGLQTQFQAMVYPANGDVTLPTVQAQLARTTVRASGSVAEQKSTAGRSAALDLAVRGGRIQDLLLLFVSSPRAPLNGTVRLRARAQVPPGDKPFLQKLNLIGDFGIDSAQFTAEDTQQHLDKLSAQARGEKPQTVEDSERVVSDLKGHVNVVNGVANFSELSFHVPGAKAKLHGTFDLLSHRVNLHGMLYMESTLPKATSGVKSFLLKAIDPFLKKNRRGGAEFPVSIKGTYEAPVYASDPV